MSGVSQDFDNVVTAVSMSVADGANGAQAWNLFGLRAQNLYSTGAQPAAVDSVTRKDYVDGLVANAGNWNTAFGWGNHASAGYLTSAPVSSVAGKTGAVVLAATDITSGTFANARISSGSVTQHLGNYATLSGSQTFSGSKTFSASMTASGGIITLGGSINVGNSTVTGAANPTVNNHHTKKLYVDNAVSDVRLKQDIQPLGDVLDDICKLDTFTFSYTEDAVVKRSYHKTRYGVSAQNVEQYFPDAVHHLASDRDDDGTSISGENYKGVDYDELVPVLIKAVQELTARVKELES